MIRIALSVATGLIGLFFLVLGLAFLFAPALAASRFAVLATDSAGYGTLRGDLGALFLGIGIFSILGARRSARRWLIVPIGFLAAIVAGRIVSLLLDGRSAGSVQALIVELIALSVLAAWRSSGGDAPAPESSWPRRLGLAGFAALVLITACAFVFQRQIGLALVRQIAERLFSQSVLDSLPDGLHAGLCGSGAPLPDPNRAGPCVFVVAAHRLYIVDAGEGSPRKLGLMQIPPGAIEAIFLTHFHSDHIAALGEMIMERWAGGGHTEPVEVFGPQGVDSVVDGFNSAYRLDNGYRVAHHGAATMPPSGEGGVARSFSVPPSGDWSEAILQRDGLTVTAFNVRHTPVFPAVGYRFAYRGRSIVISGDTAPSESLEKNAKGADVLFHEGLQTTMVTVLHDAAARHDRKTFAKIAADIPSYHTTPEDAARIADRAGVRQLVFYHILPPLPFSYLQGAFLGGAANYYHGPISVGKDGMLLSLPPDSTAISMRQLL